MANARIAGPISGGTKGHPFAVAIADIAALGYRQDEYVMCCLLLVAAPVAVVGGVLMACARTWR